jgi:hypothetical protein
MEALKNLVCNVPDWLTKLDELNGQIEQRQIELAKLAQATEAAKPTSSTEEGSPTPKSIRNKGSTESLKPRDEPQAHPRDATPQPEEDDPAALAAAAAAGAAAAKGSTEQLTPPSPADAKPCGAVQIRTHRARAEGQAQARATLRKRQRTDSVLSGEGATPKYRTRSMIIVYYDSYVQNFFEGLVKFVSASRNMMRKAKMAAKVAQIKRLAEMETPEDDEEAEGEKDIKSTVASGATTTPPLTATMAPIEARPAPKEEGEEPPPLQYVSSRQMGRVPAAMVRSSRVMYARAGGRGYRGPSGLGPDGKPQQGDVYDELDKGLEYVQSMCEHAAHQFLRDGDCAEEVANIKQRLAETKELADKEMERVKTEQPETLNGFEEIRGRSYRPPSMRKDLIKDVKPE